MALSNRLRGSLSSPALTSGACLTFPFALIPACLGSALPSLPVHPSSTHAHQIPWLLISPSAMFLEPLIGARHKQGMGGTPKVRVRVCSPEHTACWEDQSQGTHTHTLRIKTIPYNWSSFVGCKTPHTSPHKPVR